MDHDFWHNKWNANEIGFHKDETNTHLKSNLECLHLNQGATVFVPLCGKTLDISYLLESGYQVVAAELNEGAVIQLFQSMQLAPDITDLGALKQYQAPNITVFVGDIFELTQALVDQIDAIYDRAALVALPDAMRRRYAQHLITITQKAPQLLVAFEYDQTQYDGPPFAISEAMVNELYANAYTCALRYRQVLPDGLKGKCEASEAVWYLF